MLTKLEISLLQCALRTNLKWLEFQRWLYLWSETVDQSKLIQSVNLKIVRWIVSFLGLRSKSRCCRCWKWLQWSRLFLQELSISIIDFKIYQFVTTTLIICWENLHLTYHHRCTRDRIKIVGFCYIWIIKKGLKPK